MEASDKSTRKVIPIVPLQEGAIDTSEEGVWGELYAAHQKIYPRSVQGIFAKWRWGFVFLTQIIFYCLPWLEWGQRQAVLFDLGVRRFYIFGIVLYPQDFIYLTGLLVISAFSLFLFTAIAARKVGQEMVQTFSLDWVVHLDGLHVCRLLHAHSRFGHGVLLGQHVVLGSFLGFLLWLCHIRQCGLHARAGLQVHVSLCALSKRHVRQRHAHCDV